jgi:hypothetical protein
LVELMREMLGKLEQRPVQGTENEATNHQQSLPGRVLH